MCLSPFKLKNQEVSVPCGKCPQCTTRRASGWSFRLMQQEKISHASHFVTLTYDTDHVPITPKGFMCLRKKDVQDYLKRLRYAHGKDHNANTPIRYYCAGEYGSKGMRPHYHLILFNAKPELIVSEWGQGDVHIGDVTGASIGYTLKYISKQKQIPQHKNDDRLPEFSLMSKGLGSNYVGTFMRLVTGAYERFPGEPEPLIYIKKRTLLVRHSRSYDWHHKQLHDRMYIPIEGGKKASMPRYYKDKIYNADERKYVGWTSRLDAIDRQRKMDEDLQERYGDLWHYQKEDMKRAEYAKMLRKSKGNTL